MYLQSLTLHDVRSIPALQLRFGAGPDSIRRWTLLLGENGTGKSSVLRAIALALAGSDALPFLLGDVDAWVRHGADAARIELEVRTSEGQERTIRLRLARGARPHEVLADNREGLGALDAALRHAERNYFVVGYGASRRLASQATVAFKGQSSRPLRAQALATLFSTEAALDPLEAWAFDMDYRGKASALQMLGVIAEALMPGTRYHGIDREHKRLLFATPDGVTPLSQLSDGYQNVAAWCGDLLRTMTEVFADFETPEDARGLLIVDEIDLHLHPRWQRQLRRFLDKTFPNLQIVATTHSPLTAQQAAEGELYLMRRAVDPGPPALVGFQGAPNRLMIHQLLSSIAFDVRSLDAEQVESSRAELRALTAKPRKSAAERKRERALHTEIAALPDIAAGLTRQADQHEATLRRIEAALMDQGGGR